MSLSLISESVERMAIQPIIKAALIHCSIYGHPAQMTIAPHNLWGPYIPNRARGLPAPCPNGTILIGP